MPFNKKTVMEQRLELVMLASKSEVSFLKLCKRFGISRKTGYKWVSRYQEHGIAGFLHP
jgi:transposase-like protein